MKNAMLQEIRETGQLHLVISLFSGASDEEASAREWILINVLGLPNLTNMSAGNLPQGIYKLFSKGKQLDFEKVAKLGTFWLFSAFKSFLHNGRDRRPLPQSKIVAEEEKVDEDVEEEMAKAKEVVKNGSETEDEDTDSESDD